MRGAHRDALGGVDRWISPTGGHDHGGPRPVGEPRGDVKRPGKNMEKVRMFMSLSYSLSIIIICFWVDEVVDITSG